MRQFLSNTYRLGIKELWSLWRDPTMLVLIVFVFTLGVYTGATAMPETLNNASIAIVEVNRSPFGGRHEATMSVIHGRPVRSPATNREPAVGG